MSVATIVITATRANAPATTIINRGPTGPAGPAGPAGADSITSATTSDGTADINFNQVGIGTTSPAHKLTINAGNDTTALGIDFPSAHFDFSANSTSGYTTSFHMDDTATTIGGDSAARALIFQTNNTDRLYINGSTGNVGIGTTGPLQKLHVYGASNGASIYNAMFQNAGTAVGTSSKILFVSGGTTTRGADIGSLQEAVAGDATALTFGTSAAYATPTEKLRITSTGNVGIGTTSPAEKLHVIGGSATALNTQYPAAIFQASDAYTGNSGLVTIGGYWDNTNSNLRRGYIQASNSTGSDSYLLLNPNGGNVGIGTTVPSQKLDVDGAVKKAVFTVNTLPTATAGTSCYVSDSNHTHHSNVGQVVASGGSNFVPVYYDGTDWRIG